MQEKITEQGKEAKHIPKALQRFYAQFFFWRTGIIRSLLPRGCSGNIRQLCQEQGCFISHHILRHQKEPLQVIESLACHSFHLQQVGNAREDGADLERKHGRLFPQIHLNIINCTYHQQHQGAEFFHQFFQLTEHLLVCLLSTLRGVGMLQGKILVCHIAEPGCLDAQRSEVESHLLQIAVFTTFHQQLHHPYETVELPVESLVVKRRRGFYYICHLVLFLG